MDIKKIAIASGCAAVVAFAFGRFNSSPNTDGYRPITSLAHLDQAGEQLTDLPQSVAIEDAKPLPVDENTFSFEVPEPVMAPAPQEPQLQEVAEQDDNLMEIEFSDEPLSFNDEPAVDEPAVNETPNEQFFIASKKPSLGLSDEPSMDLSTEPNLDTPEIDEATVETMPKISSPEPKTTGSSTKTERVNQAKRPNWKANPFMSTNSPAFTPEDREQQFDVQPASMATPTQAVRSLNKIEGIPDAAVLPAPVQPKPHLQTSGSVLQQATPVAQVAPISMALSDTTAQKAVHHIEYGKSLIRRGANFAARSEFFSALRIIAEANDAMIDGNEFSSALSNAIRAMREAEDFAVQDAQSFAVVDVPSTIESHATKLLTPIEARRISPRSAMQRYYNYAAQQLDFAGGRNVVTAEALHCLGKLHSVISSKEPTNASNLNTSQAIVFHRSSLLSNPNNPASSNELGVLLAKSGALEEATHLFKQSLINQPTAQGWSNLAKTHQRMGEQQLAQMAQAEISVSAQSTSIATAGIQWIDTPRFNAMTPTEFEPRIVHNAPAAIQPTADTKKTKADEEPKASIAQRIKKWF